MRAPSADRLRRFALLMRAFLVASGVAGVVLLVLATRATVIQLRLAADAAGAGIDPTINGADRHGPALIVVAVFGATMLAAAMWDARAAMAAVAAAGAIALSIAIVGDAGHVHDTGAVGKVYVGTRAQAGSGFYLETLGGALLLIAGVGLLLLSGPSPAAAPSPGGEDWFGSAG